MKPADPRAKAKRAALNALKRARRAAESAGIELSEWEGEFLGSVENRVAKYGRAFADPDLGAINGALSLRQGIKLKEIAAKAKGTDKKQSARKAQRGKTKAANAKPSHRSAFGKAKPSGFKRRSPFGRTRKAGHGK